MSFNLRYISMVRWIEKVRKRREEERQVREAQEQEERKKIQDRERRKKKDEDMRRDYAERLRKEIAEEKRQKEYAELEELDKRRQQEESERVVSRYYESLPDDVQSDIDHLSEDELFDFSKLDKLNKPHSDDQQQS